jgi:ABC-type transport system involved in multi-copper enzyme maturation permease subunit
MGGRLNRVRAVAANTFRETVRERVLYNLVFFAILMTLAGLLLGQLSVRQDEKMLKDIGLAAMDLFGTLIAVFIGTGLVSKEIERRSLYPLLAKPVSRSEFFLGKFAGLAFTLLVNVSVMLLGLTLTLVFTGRRPDAALLTAAYAIYLGLLLVVAFAMLFSTLTSATLAGVLTVGVVVVGRFADVIRGMRDVLPGVPQQLTQALFAVVPNFANFDFKTRAAYGEAVPPALLGEVTLYALGWLLVGLGLGLLSFRSRDFQ